MAHCMTISRPGDRSNYLMILVCFALPRRNIIQESFPNSQVYFEVIFPCSLNLAKVKQSEFLRKPGGISNFGAGVWTMEFKETVEISGCVGNPRKCYTWTFYKSAEEIVLFTDSQGEQVNFPAWKCFI